MLKKMSDQKLNPQPETKKSRGRPKGSKNKGGRQVIQTKFGTVIESLSSSQKKMLDQLMFTATDPSTNGHLPDSVFQGVRQGRALPQNDIKKDHVLIKGLHLTKNMNTGDWEVSMIETNHGKFGTSAEQTAKINQKIVRALISYMKNVFEKDLQSFIEKERR